MMLELRNIEKTYLQGKLEVPVLKGISLSVEEGEYLAIMGPSGSGKTTLMNIIGCLDSPSSGEYILEGQDIAQIGEKAMSQVRLRSIGFVFQSFYLLSRQSALDNVALPLLYAGVRRRERLEIARRALERVGLGDRTGFKPTQLSGGQCQRVAIARSIVNNPKILLADEPTGALDTQSGEQIMEIFQRLNQEGVTIVMITHEPEIAAHAKRTLHIRDGLLVDRAGRPTQSQAAGPKPPKPAPQEPKAPAAPQPAGEAAAPQSTGEPAAPQPAGESLAPKEVWKKLWGRIKPQEPKAPAAPQPAGEAAASQSTGEPAAPQPAGEAAAPQPAGESLAPKEVWKKLWGRIKPQEPKAPAAPQPAGEAAAPQSTGEPAAPQPAGEAAAPQSTGEPAAPQPAGEAAAPSITPEPKNSQSPQGFGNSESPAFQPISGKTIIAALERQQREQNSAVKGEETSDEQ